MYSVIAFFLGLTEVGAAAIGYILQSPLVFNNVVIYGSPFYLIMHMLKDDSVLVERNPIYIGFLLFHIIKYLIIFRAKFVEDSNAMLKLAIFFEIAYLAVSGYYIN